jgi:hypothetical protein
MIRSKKPKPLLNEKNARDLQHPIPRPNHVSAIQPQKSKAAFIFHPIIQHKKVNFSISFPGFPISTSNSLLKRVESIEFSSFDVNRFKLNQGDAIMMVHVKVRSGRGK